MKPSSKVFNIEDILEDGEKLLLELTESDNITDLSEDKMYIFAGMRRASADFLMNEEQFAQAGSIVRQLLKLENDDRVRLNDQQKRIIQFTLAKIGSYRKQLDETIRLGKPKSQQKEIAKNKEKHVQRLERIAADMKDKKGLDIQDPQNIQDIESLLIVLEDFILGPERLLINELSREQRIRFAVAIDSLQMEMDLTNDSKTNRRLFARISEAKMKLADVRGNYHLLFD